MLLHRKSLLLAILLVVLGALRVAAPAAAQAQTPTSDPATVVVAGFVSALSADAITLGGQTAALTPATQLSDDIAVGVFAAAVLVDVGGQPTALVVRNLADPADGLVRVSGEILAVSAAAVNVAGIEAQLTAETQIDGALTVGGVASLVAEVGDFVLLARTIDARPLEAIVGFVTAFDATSVALNGRTLQLTPTSVVVGTPALDALFLAFVRLVADGPPEVLVLVEIAQPAALGLTLYVGRVTALDAATITVDETPFALGDESYVAPDVALDATVSVIARPTEAGGFEALVVRRLAGGDGVQRIAGRVTALTPDALWIDGQRLALGAQTQLDAPLSVGARVHAVAWPRATDDPLALRVRALPAQPTVGTLTALGADGLSVDGVRYAVTAATLTTEAVAVGDRVALSAAPTRDGAAQALLVARVPLVPSAVALAAADAAAPAALLWPALGVVLATLAVGLARRRRA